MNYEIPEKMKAWVLGDPGELTLEENQFRNRREQRF